MGWRKKNSGGRGRESINSPCASPTARLHKRWCSSGEGRRAEDAGCVELEQAGLRRGKQQAGAGVITLAGITKGTWVLMKNVSSASACPSAASHLPCKQAAWMLLLVPVGCESWSHSSAACRQELRPQGLGAQPPWTQSSIRSFLISKASLILKDVFLSHPCSCGKQEGALSTHRRGGSNQTTAKQRSLPGPEGPTAGGDQRGSGRGVLTNLSIPWDQPTESQQVPSHWLLPASS